MPFQDTPFLREQEPTRQPFLREFPLHTDSCLRRNRQVLISTGERAPGGGTELNSVPGFHE